MTTPEPSAFADWVPPNGSNATWVTRTFTTDGRTRSITAAAEETGAGRALWVRDRAAARGAVTPLPRCTNAIVPAVPPAMRATATVTATNVRRPRRRGGSAAAGTGPGAVGIGSGAAPPRSAAGRGTGSGGTPRR